ncbi:putative membrane transporter [Salmonella enterica subsp. enterica serovar Typhimurium]|nr:putative membrane transporter [Salmonella enterica subsp. enterica serovar Typhimurium]
MITHSFGIVNYLVLFGYLLAMMLVGVYFSRRQKTADDYFRGGGRVPWLGGWGQCICYYVKLNYIYVNSCQSVYFRLDVYHWSVSGYRNFTAGFLFLYSVFSEIESHISL